MGFVELTQGKVAQIDDADYEAVSAYSWFAIRTVTGGWYAVTGIKHPQRPKFSTSLQLHRFLLGLTLGDPEKVDHIDGDGLNNCRSNLRIVTSKQNRWNSGPNKNSRSQYKGVCWFPYKGSGGKWRAQLQEGEKNHRLGLFDSEEDAALAYDAKAREVHGKFARLNFPDVLEDDVK